MIKDFEETEFGTILHNGSEYFSASYLASLNISKFPTSRAGVYKKAALEGWITIHVAGKGARDGVRHFLIPEYLLEKIETIRKNKGYIENYPTAAQSSTRVVARDSIAATQMSLNDFANMPKYAIKSIRNNHAASVESEQVVDYLAFRKDWLQYSMNIYDQALALIRIKGDSMAPTLRNDDLILTDLSQSRIDDDSIYVLSIKNELVVKRIQRKLNGSFVIMTDNDAYKPEEMNEEDAMSLPVIGKVVWFGRRI